MASPDGTADSALIDASPVATVTRSFFQLVQMLERHYGPAAGLGGPGPAASELIRLRPDPSLAFPSGDVASLEQVTDSPDRFLITTTFLGLYGTTSPLPRFFSEQILWCQQHADGETRRAFLDLVHSPLL